MKSLYIFFAAIIFSVISIFTTPQIFVIDRAYAAISTSKIILIGYRVDSALVENIPGSIGLTYQNNSDTDFVGTVSMSCGTESLKKVADSKSILIFKNGGQESSLLEVKIGEHAPDVPCSVVIKDRSGLTVNRYSMTLQVTENTNTSTSGNGSTNSTSTNSNTNSSNGSYFQSLYNDSLSRFNSLLARMGDDSSTSTSQNTENSINSNSSSSSSTNNRNRINNSSDSNNINIIGGNNLSDTNSNINSQSTSSSNDINNAPNTNANKNSSTTNSNNSNLGRAVADLGGGINVADNFSNLNISSYFSRSSAGEGVSDFNAGNSKDVSSKSIKSQDGNISDTKGVWSKQTDAQVKEEGIKNFDFHGQENIFSKAGEVATSFLKDKIGEDGALKKIMIGGVEFIFDGLSGVYNMLSSLFARVFDLFLPRNLSHMIGSYWLYIYILLRLLLSLKRRNKKRLKSKKFDDQLNQDLDRDYDDQEDVTADDEDDAEQEREFEINENYKKRNVAEDFSIKENIERRKREINHEI